MANHLSMGAGLLLRWKAFGSTVPKSKMVQPCPHLIQVTHRGTLPSRLLSKDYLTDCCQI